MRDSRKQTSANAGAVLEALLAERAVVPVFQPIVDLDGGGVVGLEALARGPVGSLLERPDQLFEAARESGQVAALDELCRERAVEEALAARISGPMTLFLNVEPLAVADLRVSAAMSALLDRGVRVVLELTERDLTSDPAQLLAFAERARALGLGIALDDVGAEPASLALMPFLRAEVVKLDLRLIQERPGQAAAETMTAVAAYAEDSEAVVVAEGVETLEHVAVARSMGAVLAQGWYFGRPRSAADAAAGPPVSDRHVGVRIAAQRPRDEGAYARVAQVRTPRRGQLPLLVQISRLLERRAHEQHQHAVVLATYENSGNFTATIRRRYEKLARSAAFVGVLGRGFVAAPAQGVRGAPLAPDDPLCCEWDIAVVGPHFAAALVARDLTLVGPDPVDLRDADRDRPFDYVLTHDRALVLDVARTLMNRMLPEVPVYVAAPSESPARRLDLQLWEEMALQRDAVARQTPTVGPASTADAVPRGHLLDPEDS